MKALKYKVKISKSALSYLHGFQEEIEEVYIPKENMIINEKGHCFKKDEPRGREPVEEIEISEQDIEKLRDYLKSKTAVSKLADELFK